MDFFEAQDQARRNTWKLIVYYLLAVLLIIVSIYLVATAVFGYIGEVPRGAAFMEQVWHPALFLTVSAVILMVIITGTLFRIAQLRKGGSAVAEMLGGRKIEISTRDPQEQQLVNIIEEMSIASGVPVPDIYLLDREDNINAFAAGFGTNDAAIGVTRGALQKLNRDEMQGVVAHEFSHIFNGDMRLNIRLIGILNGILLLHIMGLLLMRSSMIRGMRGGGGGSGRGQGGAGGAMAIILLGISLLIIGYIGMIFGRMIQAAISRQREYLADAAAVQYTRNPAGLAGALRKIGQVEKGGKINDGHAMEMSHLFFANSYHSVLDRAFATHPPLEERIRAIEPSRDAEAERKKEQIRKRLEKDRIARTAVSSGKSTSGSAHSALTPEVILASIGTLDHSQVDGAGKLLKSIPTHLRKAAHEPLGAEALIYALIISESTSEKSELPIWIHELTGEKVGILATELLLSLEEGRREWYLPLAELSIPSLRQMSPEQYRSFRKTVQRLIEDDSEKNLFEFALEKVIVHQLDSAFTEIKSPKIRHHHLKTLTSELSALLSALAHFSDDDTASAWQAGLEPLKNLTTGNLELLDPEKCGIKQLDQAFDEFAVSANPVKKYMLSAAIHCIMSDNKISVDEMELFRALSEIMDSPIPLRFFGQVGE